MSKEGVMKGLSQLAVVGLVFGCASSAAAQTVVSETLSRGATVQDAGFNAAAASASMFEGTQADGTPVLYVVWGGPSGFVAGMAPRSVAVVTGDRVNLNLDVTSLLTIFYSYGTPGPCLGSFEPATQDRLQAFAATQTMGNYTSVYFQPYVSGGGIQYDTHVSGRETDAAANFTGTCAGAPVVAGSNQANGHIRSHVGNIMRVVTTFP
jgi:hypothetical protein